MAAGVGLGVGPVVRREKGAAVVGRMERGNGGVPVRGGVAPISMPEGVGPGVGPAWRGMV